MDREKELKLDPRFISAGAVNQYLQYNSAARNVMFNGHLAQFLPLVNPDERIIQSGVERELAKYTFKKELENNSRIVSIIPRYRKRLDQDSVNYVAEKIVIYEDLDNNEFNILEIPRVSDYHQYFGFEYKETETMKRLSSNDIVPAGTVLAYSNSVGENDSYQFGVNLNTCLMTHPEVNEDAIIISEKAAKALSIKIYETKTVSFGSDKFPLNIYGDENNYKPFPEIGEYIKDNGLLMVLREHDELNAPVLTSKKDVLDYNPMFDECIYCKKGSGKIIDIKSNYIPKYKLEPYSGTTELAKKYSDALAIYYKEIIDTCEEIEREYRTKYHKEWSIAPRLNRLLVEAYMYLESIDPHTYKNIKMVYKNDPTDIYRITFTIESTLEATLGFKTTDLHGGKGVISKVFPTDKMPVDKYGNRVDIILDSSATISRMNIGRLYESYISASSRMARDIIRDELDGHIPITTDEKIINRSWDTVLEYLKIIGTEQYQFYKNITSVESKITILNEIVDKEFYVYYPIDAEKKAPDLILDLNNSRFSPLIEPIKLPNINDHSMFKYTKEKILIAPMYFILLYKIADSWLSAATAKVNHFGLPIGVSKKDRDRLPGKNAPVKIMSETEVRLYASYVNELGIIELKDRANSINTHKHIYRNILNADRPSNIEKVVDRNEQPYGEDKSLEIINAIFNCAGVDIVYSPDLVPYYEYLELDDSDETEE